MFENITPKKAITFTKYSVALICCWPLPSSATKLQMRCFAVLKVLSAACVICLLLPLLYALYVHFEDPTTFAMAAALVPPCCQVVLQLCVCTVQHNRLQVRSSSHSISFGRQTCLELEENFTKRYIMNLISCIRIKEHLEIKERIFWLAEWDDVRL